MIVQAPAATKHCSKCLEEKPIEAFRVRQHQGANGRRRTECRECENAPRPLHRLKKKAKRLGIHLGRLATPRQPVEVMARVATRMLREFGGIEAWANYFGEQIDAARERSPGSRLALKAALVPALMMVAAAPYEPKPVDMEDLTDEDLAREIAKHAEQLLSRLSDEDLCRELERRGVL